MTSSYAAAIEPGAAPNGAATSPAQTQAQVPARSPKTNPNDTSSHADPTATANATLPRPDDPATQPANPASRLINDDDYMPSPPTVSPLSTPAATHLNFGEGNAGEEDEDVPTLTTGLPPPAASHEPAQPSTAVLERSTTIRPNSPSANAAELDMSPQPEPLPNRVQAIATTDPDPSIDYTARSMTSISAQAQGSVDAHVYLMNLAAQANLFAPGPTIVAPSDVSLQAAFAQDNDAFTASAEPTSASASQKFESFARVEFADSVFQMTTYAVIIGRDQRAMDQARRDEKREQSYKRRVEENARNGLPPPTPLHNDRGKFSKSYVSEEGGMLGPECSDGEDEARPVKKRRPSVAVSSLNGGDEEAQGDHVKSNRQYVSHTPGAAAVDLGGMQPTPGHIPFVGIHSPGPDIASKTRGISRQHLKIQFDKEKGVFEGIALHKNGFFCEDAHFGLDDPVTLRSGDRLQIKDVEFRFVINGVQNGKTGGYQDEEISSSKRRASFGGKEMSLDFEHSDHENFKDTSDSLLSEVENIPTPILDSEPDEDEHEVAVQSVEPEEKPTLTLPPRPVEAPVEASAEASAAVSVETLAEVPTEIPATVSAELPPEFADFPMPEIPKRRGPGRPPKDGIMSKRERRLLKKQLQETSKKTLPQDPQAEKIKRPVGRPRKNPLPEDGERPEKRKYNKRKPKEDGEEGSDAERRARERKDKKVRPKSPPLDLRKEDYTEEQLQKPSKNYGLLIDEALTNASPEGLTLKQIYKRIMAKYPWFYFYSETKGWESSVRHNLIGNEAFKKDETTGLWIRVSGIELDAGKKRKPSSPDRLLGPPHAHPHLSHPQYYQNGSYLPANNVNYPHGLPSYAADAKQPPTAYQTSSGQGSQAQVSAPLQPSTQPVYPAQAPAPAQLPPGYGTPALSRPPNMGQQSTYSSPYARPPPPANPPIKTESSGPSNPQVTPAAPVQLPPSQQASQPPQRQPSAQKQPSPPGIEAAISRFRATMLKTMEKQTPHAARIIDAAISRAKGLPVADSVPGSEKLQEALTTAVQTMITSIQNGQRGATSASPGPAAGTTTSAGAKSTPDPSPAPLSAVEAEIQQKLRSFRETMILALRRKTDKAEALVDAAINRAQGLPHTAAEKPWEDAHELMYKSVCGIISEARKRYASAVPQGSPSNSARPDQPAQSSARQEPSASPAPAQSGSGSAHQAGHQLGNGVPSASSPPRPATASLTRPGVSVQRPTSVGFARPAVSTLARPPSARKDSISAPSAPSTTPPAAVQNVSSPALPSAGVVDQIAGQKRPFDDVRGGGTTSGNAVFEPERPVKVPTLAHNVSSPAPPSAGVVDQIAGHRRQLDDGLGKATPSAGVVDQIAAGQRRHDSATIHSAPSAGVLDQIVGQRRPPMAADAAKPTLEAPSNAVSQQQKPLSSGAPSLGGSGPTRSTTEATAGAKPSPEVAKPVFPQNQSPIGAAETGKNAMPATNNHGSQIPNHTPDPKRHSLEAVEAVEARKLPSPAVNHTEAQTANHTSPPKGASAEVVEAGKPLSQATQQTGAQHPRPSSSSAPMEIQRVVQPAQRPVTEHNQRSVKTAEAEKLPLSVTEPAVAPQQIPPSSNIPGVDRPSVGTESKQTEVSKPPTNEQTRVSPASDTVDQVIVPKQPADDGSRGGTPSAGVVEQIVGQKRSLEEGPGSGNTEQREAKKIAVSPA
ncbi:hypothetical protein F4780DRAFT_755495 [Xylariomycetidae sp. FL0641]|nr:hypothetical protein F4780DRAFT_755495 [Xylariomycetidae sp. FL0641]